jgi:hypothetical protein
MWLLVDTSIWKASESRLIVNNMLGCLLAKEEVLSSRLLPSLVDRE